MDVVAVGDSIVLQVRGGVLRAAFPPAEVEAFKQVAPDDPRLFQAEALSSKGETWELQRYGADVEAGDQIFAMSDALGAWALREVAAGRDPCPLLWSLDDPAKLARFVTAARARPEGNNPTNVDDVALTRLVVPAPARD